VDATFILDGCGETPDIETTNTTIKGRGNSTWSYPKKPYKMKFPNKISLFNLTAAKEWVLLANYLDPTLIMNSVAFELGHRLGLAYTNHPHHVEVVLNGIHKGSYVLTEQVEVKAGRVAIDEKTAFLAELDIYYDEEWEFKTDIIKLPVMIKSPDMDNASGMNFVKTAMNELEDALFNPAKGFPNNNYQDLMDVNSLINFLLVNEIVRNVELHHPKSTYIYKEANKKIQWGPLWDFDWAFGYNGSGFDHFLSSKDFLFRQITSSNNIGEEFFCRFFDDPLFRQQYKERWNEVKNDVSSINSYIDDMALKLKESRSQDLKLWNNGTNYTGDNFNKMKSWLQERIEYLDKEINK
jgi:hypothetical protein